MRNAPAVLSAMGYVAVRSVLEEMLFRAAMLPHPKVDGVLSKTQFTLHSIAPLLIFVLSHLWTTRRRPAEVGTAMYGQFTSGAVVCVL